MPWVHTMLFIRGATNCMARTIGAKIHMGRQH